MNNIIHLIGQNVKREIEENVIKVLEGSSNLDEIVDSVGSMVNNIGIDTITAIIEELNQHIKEAPVDIDKPLWKNLRNANKKQALELIDFAIEETPFKTKRKSMKKARRYIVNNWEGIKNLFDGEKYRCSAEGHISHILSARLSSRPMGWSLIGLDEMARMRVFKANG